MLFSPCRVFIIAEAGVNHNGNLATAMRLVDVAVKAGVDAVKFQAFIPEALVTRDAGLAPYQLMNMPGGPASQLAMLRKLSFGKEELSALKRYCDQVGIKFLATPFDNYNAEILAELGVSCFKIGSGDIDNYPLLRHVAKKGKPLILSTGMATLGEVEAALAVVQEAGAPEVALLHCTSNYPAAYEDANLKAMVTMRDAFKVPVGYSDHTLGIELAVAAVALGAVIIEKHFTLDREMEGPDHRASLEPKELAALVRAVRNVEQALGDGRKRPAAAEVETMRVARRSLVAACNIAAGELITADKIVLKRPGTGIPPKMWDIVIGRRAKVDIPADTVLTWEMI